MSLGDQIIDIKRGLLEEKKRRAEADLYSFVKQSWPIVEPGKVFLDNWHIELISDYLTAVTNGDITRLIINIPPRYMKSLLVSVMWPCWEWIKYPSFRWLFSSYAEDLARDNALRRRDIILSPWYQYNWGHIIKLDPEHNTVLDYRNTYRGAHRSTAVGGATTGKGGERIVPDDLLKAQDATSEAKRFRANYYFGKTLFNRLNNPKEDAIVMIMQRLHQDDPVGHIINFTREDLKHHILQKDEWTVVRIPMECEVDEKIYSPLDGHLIVDRREGDLLWPDRDGAEQIAEKKRQLTDDYPGQYQQRPTVEGGSIIKDNWFIFYRTAPTRFNRVIMSWDCAFKDNKASSYVVGQTWGDLYPHFYLLNQIRSKMDFPTTMQMMDLEYRRMRGASRVLLIEDKANGPGIISVLKHRFPGIIPFPPVGSKAARLRAVAPIWQSGSVHIPDPDGVGWVNDYIDEITNFPLSTYDDQVDATSQALMYMTEGLIGNEDKQMADYYGIMM